MRALRRDLDDLAEIHHGDAVRHVLDDRQIMADEQHREPELALQILQQVDDLRLHRDVERRHRFIADDQVGLGGECARDADALALPAGELVRPAVRRFARQPHPVDQRADPRIEIGRRCRESEIADRLGDDVLHAHARIEARERVLKHDLHAPPHRPQRAGRKIVDALPVEHHLAGGDVEQLAGSRGRPSTCRSRFRRPAPASRRARSRTRRRRPHRPMRTASRKPPTDGKVLLEIVDFEERAHAAATSSRGA